MDLTTAPTVLKPTPLRVGPEFIEITLFEWGMIYPQDGNGIREEMGWYARTLKVTPHFLRRLRMGTVVEPE